MDPLTEHAERQTGGMHGRARLACEKGDRSRAAWQRRMLRRCAYLHARS
jgi:hypothetical protein